MYPGSLLGLAPAFTHELIAGACPGIFITQIAQMYAYPIRSVSPPEPAVGARDAMPSEPPCKRRRVAAPAAGSPEDGCREEPGQNGSVAGVSPKTLKVVEDFCGLGTAFIAATRICKQVHRFTAESTYGCDKSRVCKKLCQHNHQTKRFDNDVVTRDVATMQQGDIYAFSAPCTSFSPLGTHEGMDNDTGALLFVPLRYIGVHRPAIVMSENSPLLAGKFKGVADTIVKWIQDRGYVVKTAILNTMDFGIPHRRKRWYLLAVRSDIVRLNTCGVPWFPAPLSYMVPLDAIIRPLPRADWRPHPVESGGKTEKLYYNNVMTQYEACCAKSIDPFKKPVIVDMAATPGFSYHSIDVAPTLTRNRTGSFGYWCSTKGGPLDHQDFAHLQGFEDSDIDHINAGVSVSQLAACYGNSTSVNVVVRVLAHGLYMGKYIQKCELEALTI